jgi:hypothetical protein
MAKNRKYNETLTLIINPAKKEALLQVLKLFDIGEVETKQLLVEQYVQNAPKNIPIDEDELADLVSKSRKNKTNNGSKKTNKSNL